MKFTTKDIIFSACLCAIGWAIYTAGKVLNDFDVAIAQIQNDIQVLKQKDN